MKGGIERAIGNLAFSVWMCSLLFTITAAYIWVELCGIRKAIENAKPQVQLTTNPTRVEVVREQLDGYVPGVKR